WRRANSAGTFFETRRSLRERISDVSDAVRATRSPVHATGDTPSSATSACQIAFPETSENRRRAANTPRPPAARLPHALPRVAAHPPTESAHGLAPHGCPIRPALRRCTAAPTPELRDATGRSPRRSVVPSALIEPATQSKSAWPAEPPAPAETMPATPPPNDAPPQSCSASCQVDGAIHD